MTLEKDSSDPKFTGNTALKADKEVSPKESIQKSGTNLQSQHESTDEAPTVDFNPPEVIEKNAVAVDDSEYHLKVKSEYVLSEPHSVLSPIQRAPPPTEKEIAAMKNPQKENRHKKNVKAMHKRNRDEHGNDIGKACRATVLGKPCPYGDKCRYNHDMKEILANRENDIAELKDIGCPMFNIRG